MENIKNKREFVNELTIKLAEYEDERKKYLLRWFSIQLTSILGLCVFFKITISMLRPAPFIFVLFSIILLAGIIYFFCNFFVEDKKFKNFLKEKCKSNILRNYNLITGNEGLGFPYYLLKDSNLFCKYTYEKTDDVIMGKYKNVEYTISETKLIIEVKNFKFTVFKGVIISFKSNKKILAETLVTTKGDNNIRNYPPNSNFTKVFIGLYCIMLCGICILLDIKFPIIAIIILAGISIALFVEKNAMKDVNLEDVSFDKRFNVYTKDQVEARYLLTTTFMDRLKSLETSFGTKGIKCSFFDDNIMFAIPTKKDLFELGSLYHSLKSQKQIEEFYNELESIQQMIDQFKLNENTGL